MAKDVKPNDPTEKSGKPAKDEGKRESSRKTNRRLALYKR